MSQFYFAWSGPLDPWDVTMLHEDEKTFAITINHVEGDFPALHIDLKNPRVGLLAAGRNVWWWLSYTPDPVRLGRPDQPARRGVPRGGLAIAGAAGGESHRRRAARRVARARHRHRRRLVDGGRFVRAARRLDQAGLLYKDLGRLRHFPA